MLVAAAAGPAAAQSAMDKPYPVGTVTVDFKSLAAGVGVSWGEGSLWFKSEKTPFKISGLSVGALGYTDISAAGNVYNLENAADLAGTYLAVQAGAAVGPEGQGRTAMRNNKGVLIVLYEVRKGLSLDVGAQGVTIEMKK
jgi:hypothetical protein